MWIEWVGTYLYINRYSMDLSHQHQQQRRRRKMRRKRRRRRRGLYKRNTAQHRLSTQNKQTKSAEVAQIAAALALHPEFCCATSIQTSSQTFLSTLILWIESYYFVRRFQNVRRNYFGENCLEMCSCLGGAPCHHKTGRCICPPGWRGKHCEKGSIVTYETNIWFAFIFSQISQKQNKRNKIFFSRKRLRK